MEDFVRTHGGRLWEWFHRRADGPHALLWLIILSVLEPVISPIVPETLMVPMVLARKERWKAFAAILIGFTTMGCIIGYLIGDLFFELLGRYLLSWGSGEEVFMKAQLLMSAHAFLTMFWISFTPLPDKVFVLAAGFLSAPFLPFLLGSLVGRALRVALIAYAAARYGEQAIALIRRYFGFLTIVAVAIIAALIVMTVR